MESLIAATYHLTSACSRQPGDCPPLSEGTVINANTIDNAEPHLELSEPATRGQPSGSEGSKESLPLLAAPQGGGARPAIEQSRLAGNDPSNGTDYPERNQDQQGGHGSDDMEVGEAAVLPGGGGAHVGGARQRRVSTCVDQEAAAGCRRALEAGDGAGAAEEGCKRPRMSNDGDVGGAASIDGAGGGEDRWGCWAAELGGCRNGGGRWDWSTGARQGGRPPRVAGALPLRLSLCVCGN